MNYRFNCSLGAKDAEGIIFPFAVERTAKGKSSALRAKDISFRLSALGRRRLISFHLPLRGRQMKKKKISAYFASLR